MRVCDEWGGWIALRAGLIYRVCTYTCAFLQLLMAGGPVDGGRVRLRGFDVFGNWILFDRHILALRSDPPEN